MNQHYHYHDHQICHETILTEAQKLNCDLGRHIKNCSFSSQLSGRFYQNNSLESHKARAHRIAQMKARRKQLERSLLMEEKKILYLEAKLKERKLKRLKEEELRLKMENAATKIQSHARRLLSMKKLEVLKIEWDIVNYVVRVLQSMFRGWKDRQRVYQLRLSIIRHRKEENAAITIQTYFRRFLAQRELGKRIDLRIKEYNKAACDIQALIRGFICRRAYLAYQNMRMQTAATKIQSNFRGFLGRRIRDARMYARKKRQEKAKRIPLHERRYSIYSIDSKARESNSRRRFTDIVSTVTRSSTFHASVKNRRLTGLEILRLAHSEKDAKENNNVDWNKSNVRQSRCSIRNNLEHFNEANEEVKIIEKVDDNKTAPMVTMSEDDEKHARARQRAAARAAKLKKQNDLEKQKKLKQSQDKKHNLEQLELSRRNNMKLKSCTLSKNEQNLPTENTNILKESSADKCLSTTNVSAGKTNPTLNRHMDNNKKVCKIVLDVEFDDEFEEEFCENEYDLEDTG